MAPEFFNIAKAQKNPGLQQMFKHDDIELLTGVASAVRFFRVGFAMEGAGNGLAVSAHAPAVSQLRQTLPWLEASVYPASGPETARYPRFSLGEAAG